MNTFDNTTELQAAREMLWKLAKAGNEQAMQFLREKGLTVGAVQP